MNLSIPSLKIVSKITIYINKRNKYYKKDNIVNYNNVCISTSTLYYYNNIEHSPYLF